MSTCHCTRPVAAATGPLYEDLGPAARALCEECLPVRCDVEPGACDSTPPPRCLVGMTITPSFCECHDCYVCGAIACGGHTKVEP